MMEYYIATKKNKPLTRKTICMNFRNLMWEKSYEEYVLCNLTLKKAELTFIERNQNIACLGRWRVGFNWRQGNLG